MKKHILGAAAALSVTASSMLATAAERDYISIVGSSTVYPFATVVAERFGKSSGFKTPKIESTGSGGGLKLFCSGVGIETPDITNASRKIKDSEIELCASNGVTGIIEVLIGYDGIAVANSKVSKQLDISLRDIYLALAAEVPNPDGSETFVANPYKTWQEVNPSLPAIKIEVLGPPPTSGTRDAFNELAVEGGCKTFEWVEAIKSSDKSRYKGLCRTIREDGHYIEAGENDNLIVQKLEANPNALGVFGFSFLDQNSDKVQASTISGVAPTFESIADFSYPVSRPLYFYVKKAHVGKVPGMQEYLAEFVSEKAMGEDGYLSEKGMIPLSEEELEKISNSVKNLETL